MKSGIQTTGRLAEFVANTRYDDFPSETVKLAKELILHCLGGNLGGCKELPSKILIDFVRKSGGVAEAGVIGAGFKSSAVNAAYVGGVTPHAIEVEDGSWPGAASPITVVPVCFALGEKMGVTGRAIVESFVIGFEIQGKLACAAATGTLSKGTSTLATMGTLGAAAAAAKILGLNVDMVSNSLGLAASQAAGLTECSVGNMTHYFQSGASCRNGLTAALLAQAGSSAHNSCLETKHGLLDVLCGEGDYDLAKVTENLGSPFHIHQVRVKKYPVCTFMHRVIDGVLALVNEHNILPDQVDFVEIGVNAAVPTILRYPEPKDIEEAKFSMQYNVATAILMRKLDLEDITLEAIFESTRREFSQQITMIVHPDWDSGGILAGINTVSIRLKDGREFSRDCVYATGGPEAPLSTSEVRVLFEPMARRVLAEKDVQRVEDLILNLESVTDLTELNDLLLGQAD
ncbi:MmgE/PrpD family protein [Chloroflexota bacterium]